MEYTCKNFPKKGNLDFGEIFNPLDKLSHPATPADNDMDGIVDDADIDDDNEIIIFAKVEYKL